MPRRNKTIPHEFHAANEACTKKRRYANDRQALEVAAYQMLLKPALQLGVYKCTHCNGWHLTNIGEK